MKIDCYTQEYKVISHFIQNVILQPNRTKYPILLVRGIPNTGKYTFVRNVFKKHKCRMNFYSSLQTRGKTVYQELTEPNSAKIDIMSMFEKHPKPIVYGFRHMERVMNYEKAIYKGLLTYLKSTTPSLCRPIVFILTEPLNTTKYQDILHYVECTLDLEGFTRKQIEPYLTQYTNGSSFVLNQMVEYCHGDFIKLKRVMHNGSSLNTRPILLNEIVRPTFLEDNYKTTMTERIHQYFTQIGHSSIPNEIRQWTLMFQETELSTMGQTIHENMLDHTTQTIQSYYSYLNTYILANQNQLLQHLYNRHAVEPFWIHSMIYLPFQMNTPNPSKNIRFTKMLTRSSIQSNYRNFIDTVQRTSKKSFYEFMCEYEEALLNQHISSKKQRNQILNTLYQKWMEEGLILSDVRRLTRSIERIHNGCQK